MKTLYIPAPDDFSVIPVTVLTSLLLDTYGTTGHPPPIDCPEVLIPRLRPARRAPQIAPTTESFR